MQKWWTVRPSTLKTCPYLSWSSSARPHRQQGFMPGSPMLTGQAGRWLLQCYVQFTHAHWHSSTETGEGYISNILLIFTCVSLIHIRNYSNQSVSSLCFHQNIGYFYWNTAHYKYIDSIKFKLTKLKMNEIDRKKTNGSAFVKRNSVDPVAEINKFQIDAMAI